MKNEYFGKQISFTEKMHDIVYFDKPSDKKLYVGNVPEELNVVHIFNYKIPRCYRKIVFCSTQYDSGIIIGQTYKREGEYNPGYSRSQFVDDAEAPSLTSTKTYTFWEVAVGMNKIVLVPKDSNYKISL